MNWTNFRTYELGHQKGFEALCNQIFECWLRDKFKGQVIHFTTIRGDGGDGGVEAYAELNNATFVGLQSKWFPDGLLDSQISQIEKSIRTAMAIRPQIRVYIVCLPSDLTSLKKVKGDKVSASTEEIRWNNLKIKIKSEFPDLELILWDDHNLTTLLQRQDLEGVSKFWFDKEIITSELLKQQFAKSKGAWLRERYVPDLHALGHIDVAVDILNRSNGARDDLIGKMSDLYEAGARLIRELQTLEKVLARQLDSPLKEFLQYLSDLDEYLRHNISCCDSGDDLSIFEKTDPKNSYEIDNQLEELSKTNARILCDDIKKHIDEFYKIDHYQLIVKSVPHWNMRFRLFSGDPGTGKTHALAHATETSLSLNRPALLIQAKAIIDPSSWQSILQSSLGIGTDWSEGEILGALQSRAAISKIDGVYNPSNKQQGSCFLICVDGLDETQDWSSWQNRIKEIQVLTKSYPQLRFLVTGRDYFFEKTGLDINLRQYLNYLPPEGDVPVRDVFEKYMSKFQIDVSEVPWVKWSIRSLLELRLFCDQYKGRRFQRGDQVSTTIGGLLKDRFSLIEREFVDQIRPKTIGPDKFLFSLRKVAEYFLQHEEIRHDDLVSLIRAELKLEDGYVNTVVDHLINHGLLVAFKKGSAGPLHPGETFYQPSFQPVVEFLIALEVIELVRDKKSLPKHLEGQIGVLRIASTMLFVDHGVLPAKDGLWGDILEEDTINELRCVALSSAPPERTFPYIEWVKTELKSSMPRSRSILARLCYPICHVPEHPLGPKLVDHVLKSFVRAADRDIIWSGLEYVSKNHGAVWEGQGPNPIRDGNYSLNSDEKFDGLPLLHAWNLTSIDNSILGTCSKNLVRWGAENPGELFKLLNHMLPSNDPQLEEYFLLVILGSVTILKPSQNNYIGIFANWFLEKVFSADGLLRYRSSIIRAVGRAVVERAHELRLITNESASLSRPPFNVVFDSLPLSVDAAKETESYGPVWHDLAWYVIKGAYKGFFETKRESQLPEEETEENSDRWINEKEVEYLLSEDLGPLGNEEKARLEQSLKNKKEQMRIWKEKHESITERLSEKLDVLLNKDNEEGKNNPDLKMVLDNLKITKPSKEYETDAEAILKKHSDLLGFQINPHQLALSAVCKFAENLGWSEEVFRGNLNGGQVGEILGADFAISRKHFMSSHGSRSRIMAFGEKYVWCAVHYLQGYFSDYIAYSSWDKRERVNDYSNIEDFFNPSQPMPPKYGKHRIISPCLLSPDEPAIQGDLRAATSNWVKAAALPNLKEWILPDLEFTKHVSAERALCLIYCFNSQTESTGLADTTLWVHTFLVNESDFISFEKSLSLKNIFLQRLMNDPNHGMKSGVECECYISPRDAIFMGWKKELDPSVPLKVIKDGKVSEIELQKCVCEVSTSSNSDGEQTFYMPTKLVREGLGITRGDGINFEDELENQIAFSVTAGEAFRDSQDNLYVDRQKFLDFLKREQKFPVWLVRLDRGQSTKGFHSIGKVNPEVTNLHVYYLRNEQLFSFEFTPEEQ